MTELAGHLVTRVAEFFPFALICIGLVATIVWTGGLVALAFGGAWSALSG